MCAQSAEKTEDTKRRRRGHQFRSAASTCRTCDESLSKNMCAPCTHFFLKVSDLQVCTVSVAVNVCAPLGAPLRAASCSSTFAPTRRDSRRCACPRRGTICLCRRNDIFFPLRLIGQTRMTESGRTSTYAPRRSCGSSHLKLVVLEGHWQHCQLASRHKRGSRKGKRCS